MTKIYKQLTDTGRIDAMARAIANAEGWNNAEYQARLGYLNNPGNIGPGRQYATPAEGWAALKSLIVKIAKQVGPYKGAVTIEQVAKTYTGEVAYKNWSNNVANFLGISPSDSFGGYVNG